MPQMQWLRAERKGHHYHFRVWLDTDQKDANGQPQADYVREYHYSIWPPGTDFATTPPTVTWKSATLNGVTYTTWESYVQAEVQLLAAAHLAELTPAVTALAVQGQTFVPAVPSPPPIVR